MARLCESRLCTYVPMLLETARRANSITSGSHLIHAVRFCEDGTQASRRLSCISFWCHVTTFVPHRLRCRGSMTARGAVFLAHVNQKKVTCHDFTELLAPCDVQQIRRKVALLASWNVQQKRHKAK